MLGRLNFWRIYTIVQVLVEYVDFYVQPWCNLTHRQNLGFSPYRGRFSKALLQPGLVLISSPRLILQGKKKKFIDNTNSKLPRTYSIANVQHTTFNNLFSIRVLFKRKLKNFILGQMFFFRFAKMPHAGSGLNPFFNFLTLHSIYSA